MEAVQHVEVWDGDDEDLQFVVTEVHLQQGSREFYALTSQRYSHTSDIDVSKLNCIEFDRSLQWPPFPSDFTRAPEPLPAETYVKRPTLFHYPETPTSPESLTRAGTLQLREARICEMLRHKPHPAIAKYLGCVVQDDRITGLCFVQYGPDLSDRLNDGPPVNKEVCMQDVKAAVAHLHDMGLIHCDINPNNILSDGDHYVLADFDSCTMEGEELGLKGGTHGWSQDVKVATREVDQYGLRKLEELLFSTP